MRHRLLAWLELLAFAAVLCAPAMAADSNYLLVDQAGIDAAKGKARSQPWAAKALDALLRDADRRLASKLEIPGRGGQWPHWYSCKRDGVKLETVSPTEHKCPHCGAVYSGEPFDSVPLYGVHSSNAQTAQALGLAFRFTGKPEYAARAREILTEYADRYRGYRLHDKDGNEKIGGGRVMAQTLDEAVWLIPMAWSYALVRETMTADAKAHVEADLFRPAADVIRQHKMAIHNIQCWKNSAVGLAGFVTGDQALVKEAIDDPDRGFRAQISRGVKDGIWWEGSLGYHHYTMQSLWPLAEAARLAGTDLYDDGYRALFDGPLAVALPNGDAPGFNDNAGSNVSRMASLYELAYARWRRPEYGRLVTGSARDSLFALLWGAADAPSGDPIPRQSQVLREMGFAMLRSPALTAAVRFGMHGGGHGHPDKLNVVTYGGGRLLGLDPGSINYGVPLHQEWYRSTIAHNTVAVDGASQSTADGRLVSWSTEAGVTKLVASAPAAYKGVTLQRSLGMSAAGRLSDRFECTSTTDEEHTYDWAFHAPGRLTMSVEMSARAEALGDKNGYQHLKKLASGKTDGAFTARWLPASGTGPALMLRVEAAPGTEVFTAVGPGRDPVDEVPVLIVRRRGKAAVFAVTHEMEPSAAPTR